MAQKDAVQSFISDIGDLKQKDCVRSFYKKDAVKRAPREDILAVPAEVDHAILEMCHHAAALRSNHRQNSWGIKNIFYQIISLMVSTSAKTIVDTKKSQPILIKS